MAEKHRPRSGSRFSLNPLTAAVLDATPPLGYKRPPTLIGSQSVSTAQRLLRAKNYASAYKSISIKDWNSYVAFGIQQFDSPATYLTQCASETPDEKNLRVARYYRFHLESHALIERHLMQHITTVETALKVSYPGYFEMSVREMDEYVRQLSPVDAMEIESQSQANDSLTTDVTIDTMAQVSSSLSLACAYASAKSSPIPPPAGAKLSDLAQPPNCRTHIGGTAASIQDISAQKDASPFIEAATSPYQALTQDNTSFGIALTNTLAPIDAITAEILTPMKVAPQQAVTDFSSSSASMYDTARFGTTPDGSTASTSNAHSAAAFSPHKVIPRASTLPKIPSRVTNPLRVDVRWSPKDFTKLKKSTSLMFARFAPILSGFNTTHSWVAEWQTDQMAKAHIIEPAQLAQFLSIRKITSVKQQCFYFSFRLNASGSQFLQVLKSKALQALRQGENISFDTSHIPPTHGEVTNIGDILLKDAKNTHRGHYLQYLRSEVLPPETPAFDLKILHTDPIGNRVPILTVRCGKSVSTQVAQLLSTHLNGEGTNPEIFISRLALGANRSARGNHEKIYQVHQDYLSDIVYLPFLVTTQLDTALAEYSDSGEQLQRSPRQWAKSLVAADGSSLEIDIENGNSTRTACLIVPSASLEQAQRELLTYCQRQNPRLLHAERLYTASVRDDPEIPLTIFTKNIDTILAKKIRKILPTSTSTSVLSPASSLTGQTAKTSKTSKTSTIAWQVPLREPSVSKHHSGLPASAPASIIASKREEAQHKRILSLEAQLTSMSAGNSRASGEKSQLSGSSPTSLATAHARLDGIETTVLNIQTLLTKLVTTKDNDPPLPDDNLLAPSWPQLPCKQLFPDASSTGHTLAILHPRQLSPVKQKAAKRRKAAIPIATDLIPHLYNSDMESGGQDSC